MRTMGFLVLLELLGQAILPMGVLEVLMEMEILVLRVGRRDPRLSQGLKWDFGGILRLIFWH